MGEFKTAESTAFDHRGGWGQDMLDAPLLITGKAWERAPCLCNVFAVCEADAGFRPRFAITDLIRVHARAHLSRLLSPVWTWPFVGAPIPGSSQPAFLISLSKNSVQNAPSGKPSRLCERMLAVRCSGYDDSQSCYTGYAHD